MTLKEKGKLAARRIFKKYNLTCPVDLHSLAKRLNIEVYETDDLPDRVSGVVTRLEDLKWVASINRRHTYGRRRFTLAHEIGHVVLNHCDVGFQIVIVKSESKLTLKERQADVFAAELLMPKHAFQNAYFNRGIKDPGELAKLFGVSKQAVEIRIEQIKKQSAFDQLSLL